MGPRRSNRNVHAAETRSQGASRKPQGPSQPGTSTGRVSRHAAWGVCALGAATVLVFWAATRCDFVNFDDDQYVYRNAWVRQGLCGPSIVAAATRVVVANWHPLTMLSHLFDVTLFGPDRAAGHHAVNVLLHAANAGLFAWVLARSTGRVYPSLLAAALWAWHPLRVESVVWVSERKDVLSTLAWLAAWAAYLNYAQRPRGRAMAVVAGLLSLGLLAKPMVVTFPFAMLLLDAWPLGRWNPQATAAQRGVAPDKRRTRGAAWWPLVREKWPLFGLVLVSSIVTYLVQRSAGAVGANDLVPWPDRVANAVLSAARYLALHAWPARLAVYYPHPRLAPLSPWVLASAAGWLTLLALAFWQRRRGYLAVGCLWFLGTLVPVAGLVQVGGQGLADRYTYLPGMGLCWAGVWLCGDLGAACRVRFSPRWQRPSGAAVVVAIVALLSGLIVQTERQIFTWRTSVSLFEHAARVVPNNAVAWNNLGWARIDRGEVPQGLACFEQALKIRPALLPARLGRGTACDLLGRLDEAESAYRALLRGGFRDHRLLNNAAWLWATHPNVDRRRPLEAVALAREAIGSVPDENATYLDTLAAALASQGAFSEALAVQQRVIELTPAGAPRRAAVARSARYQAGQGAERAATGS